MIVMIDNFDSFTYNLVQYLRQLGTDVEIFRNNAVSVEEISSLNPTAIVISPGPGRPEGAGISLDVIKTFSGKIPLLGVCLGHQAIAVAFGARIISAKDLKHGKTSMVTADGKGIYAGVKRPFQAMRYHSLAVDESSLSEPLTITARTEDGEIMGIRHQHHITEGMQFHPESIMTPTGKRLLRNFLNLAHNKTQ